MTQEQVRVGVIGCGAGIFHLEGYAADPRVKIVALAGLDTDRCASLARRFDIPNVYREYQELLAQDDIDAVSIAVPNFLHMPVAVAALEAGKHVLIEKPLARNTEEGKLMVEAAARNNRILAVSFQRRTRHDVEIVRDQIAAGSLGRVYYSKAYWMRRSGIPGLGSWFTSKEAAGGGPLIDLGVHVLDMALYMLGNPIVTTVSAATYAEIGTRGRGNWVGRRSSQSPDDPIDYEVEDLATAFLRFDDGGTLAARGVVGVVHRDGRRFRCPVLRQRRRRADPLEEVCGCGYARPVFRNWQHDHRQSSPAGSPARARGDHSRFRRAAFSMAHRSAPTVKKDWTGCA